MVRAESLPLGKFGSGGYTSRTSSVTVDINRNINHSEYVSYGNHFFPIFHFFVSLLICLANIMLHLKFGVGVSFLYVPVSV